jgi:predicted Abi (CAAX) family protease
MKNSLRMIKYNACPAFFTCLLAVLAAIFINVSLSAASPFSDETAKIEKTSASKFEIADPEVLYAKQLQKSSTAKIKNAKYFRKTGEWTGKLYLPKINRRDPAGGVLIKIENSPLKGMIGKLVWLRWDTGQPWEKWFNTLRYDVSIDADRLQKAMKDGLNPPVALDGWKKVSPLESLAGARPGDITVLLKNPKWTGKVLLINEEPVQICGNRIALAKFLGPVSEGRQKIIHYSYDKGGFYGPQEIVAIPATFFSRSNTPIARSSTVDIEKKDLNENGWYLYGRHHNGVFEVEALEPAEAFTLSPTISVEGKNEVKNYISREHFDDLKTGMVKKTELLPGKEYDWKEGDTGLLIHVFGWREHPSEKSNPMMMGLVTGHFAFGMAKVIKCPFSKKLRWDLEYRQVYAHNREGLVAGSMKWHNYSGSLLRGWMYTIPISDTVIRIPELNDYDFDGWLVKPWSGLNREFEKMQALYRTGAGTGISSVKPDISCVQDSHAALYSALRTFEETIAKTGAVKKWISANPKAEEVKRYLRLLLLVRELKRNITTFGLAQGNWRQFFKNPLGTRNPNAVASLLNALLSKRSVFPRKGHDNLLRFAAERGYPMWTVLTCQVGGTIPEITPLAPSSPTAR